MKSQFSFTVKNVSAPMAEVNIGEFSVSAEIEYSPEEFLRLTEMSGAFYAWLAEKAEPILEVAVPLVIAAMECDAAKEAAVDNDPTGYKAQREIDALF